MADLVVGAKLTADGSQAIQTLKEYKLELKAASGHLLAMQDKFGEFSKEAVNAAKHVATLKDKIEDSKKMVDAFNPDRKFAAFGQSVQGVVGGFAALQGVMGLVGGESQNLEKTLLKVQSAMALAAGLDQMRESIQGFKTLTSIVGSGLVKALQSVKTAIAATGIGVLLIAIGSLVAYWDDIKAAISGVSAEQERLNRLTQENTEIEKKKLDHLNTQDNVLRLQGKSEKQILELKAKQTQAVIDRMVKEIDVQKQTLKAQIEAEARNKSILQGIIQFVTVPLQLILNGIAKIGQWLGKDWTFNVSDWISSWIFDPEEVKKNGEAAIAELENQKQALINQKAGFQLQINDINKRSAEEAARAAEAEYYARNLHLQRLAQLEQEGLDRIREIRSGDVLNKKVGLNGTTSAVSKDGAGIAQVGQELADEGMTPEQKQLKILEETFKKRMDLVRGHAEMEAAVTRSYEAQKIALEKTVANQKLAIVSNTLGKAAELVGKQTAAGKALAIAQAVINTWTGATEVLKTKSVLPEPIATISKAVNFAATVATGLKAVKEIIKTPTPGGGGGGSVPSVPSVSAPLEPSAQQTTTTLDQNSINSIGNAASRAFVLETDIQNNRERIERLNRAARI